MQPVARGVERHGVRDGRAARGVRAHGAVRVSRGACGRHVSHAHARVWRGDGRGFERRATGPRPGAAALDRGDLRPRDAPQPDLADGGPAHPRRPHVRAASNHRDAAPGGLVLARPRGPRQRRARRDRRDHGGRRARRVQAVDARDMGRLVALEQRGRSVLRQRRLVERADHRRPGRRRVRRGPAQRRRVRRSNGRAHRRRERRGGALFVRRARRRRRAGSARTRSCSTWTRTTRSSSSTDRACFAGIARRATGSPRPIAPRAARWATSPSRTWARLRRCASTRARRPRSW
jgi:hypothetical protein